MLVDLDGLFLVVERQDGMGGECCFGAFGGRRVYNLGSVNHKLVYQPPQHRSPATSH